MKIKRILAALLFAALLLPAFSCAAGEAAGDTVTVWFPAPLTSDLSESPLTSVSLPVSRNADKVTAAMRALLGGTGGCASPYIPGVQMTGVQYDDGRVTVDFNEVYLDMDGAALACAEACAVLTLCGIDGITGASFTSGGVRHMSGERKAMSAEDVVTGDLSLKPVEREVSVYFSDGSTQYIVSETRNVVLRENALLERYVIEELIKGPNDDTLFSTLPRGTSLVSVSSENRICYVNFSAEFSEIMSWTLDRRIQTLTAVTNSLCGVDGVDCVQYYAAGDRMFDVPMYANDIANGKYADDSIDCTVYLPSDDHTSAVGVTMRVGTAGGFDLNRLLAERLATGVDGNGFMSALPRGTRVNSVTVSAGVAIIDFSREFAQNDPPGGVPRSLMEMTAALTLASTSEGVDAVSFLVDGEPYDGGKIVTADFDIVDLKQ